MTVTNKKQEEDKINKNIADNETFFLCEFRNYNNSLADCLLASVKRHDNIKQLTLKQENKARNGEQIRLSLPFNRFVR